MSQIRHPSLMMRLGVSSSTIVTIKGQLAHGGKNVMEKIREKLLTIKEFAEALGCTVSCARRWVQERRIASVKVGRRLVRIPDSEVERLLIEGLRPVCKSSRWAKPR